MNEILTHDIKLLGLVMPEGEELGSYFTELPEYFTKCIDFRDLYRLKPRKRNDTKDNLEIFTGMDILIHVASENRYYYRTLKEYSDMNKLLKFFKDENLYILKDEYRVKEEEPDITEPIPETKKAGEEKDEEFLIF
jgi:hypothetical protein